MKKIVLLPAMGILAAWAAGAQAQELGRVLSATPVIQQVAVPRQVCTNQPMVVQQQPGTSGAGAVIGGLVGGAVGNQIGHGSGRAAATALGVIGGALLGNNVEGQQANAQPIQNVQQCTTQTYYENRTMGYNVRYEYAGKEYSVQMPYDPGPTIRLQVTPITSNMAPGADPALPPEIEPRAYGTPQATIIGAPAVAAYPAYPTYGYRAAPYYLPPPVGISLNLGYVSGHRHRHWR